MNFVHRYLKKYNIVQKIFFWQRYRLAIIYYHETSYRLLWIRIKNDEGREPSFFHARISSVDPCWGHSRAEAVPVLKPGEAREKVSRWWRQKCCLRGSMAGGIEGQRGHLPPSQILKDNFTLFQPGSGGRSCPPHHYLPPWIFRPSAGSELNLATPRENGIPH